MTSNDSDKITRDAVLKLARLCNLSISDSEIEPLTTKIGAIIGYIDKLQSLKDKVHAVNATSHATEITNVFRNDTVEESLPVDDGLAAAPSRLGTFIKVPLVVDSSVPLGNDH